MKYPLEFRIHVLSLGKKEGLTYEETAIRFGIGRATLARWIKCVERKPYYRAPNKIADEALRADVEQYPDAYQAERAKRFGVTVEAICYALKRLCVTYKKALRHPKANADKRQRFQQKMEHHKAEGRPIVYLDESGFAHDMPRTHGYAPRGKRCYGTQDWGAKGRTNVIGAMVGACLLTVSLFDCNINSDVFHAWTEQDLLPKLPKNAVIVMDNATFHKRQNTQRAIAEAGFILEYLPPYSPDLNPIEQKWAQAKAIRRKYKISISKLFKEHNF